MTKILTNALRVANRAPCVERVKALTVLRKTAEWIEGQPGFLRLIDQTLLPNRLEYRDCKSAEEVWEAIRSLRVRGAPAIGIAAAYGVVVAVQHHRNASSSEFATKLAEVAGYLRTSRPTAVNLFWALDRMEAVGSRRAFSPAEWVTALLQEAHSIRSEDAAMCRAIGRFGAELIGPGQGVRRRTRVPRLRRPPRPVHDAR